jgi:signal transduction histidine kinase
MKIQLTSFDVREESDIALSEYLAKRAASLAGLKVQEQLRFASAVREVTCNVVEHANGGNVIFNWQKNGRANLEAVISDGGKGIKSLEKILLRDPRDQGGLGLGLVHARRVCDDFEIITGARGTTVTLRKTLSESAEAPAPSTLRDWKKQLQPATPPAALDLTRNGNHHLRSLTDACEEQETIMKQQATEISELKQRLQKHQANMKDFTHTVSHDLRTPLTSLGLSLSLVDMDEIPEAERSNIQIAARSAKRLETMIKGLLEMLEMHNPARHEIKRIDLAALVDQTIQVGTRGLAENSFHFDVQTEPGLSIVYNTPFLENIFSHLISNSVKFRRDEPLVVQINIKPAEDGLHVHYRDNGSGIDLVTNARKMFTPFSRFTTESDGKGNGLYMIKTMVEYNGGTVQVESEVGKGTTFMLDLVSYKAETEEEPAAKTA